MLWSKRVHAKSAESRNGSVPTSLNLPNVRFTRAGRARLLWAAHCALASAARVDAPLIVDAR